jgi:hypothetical protein
MSLDAVRALEVGDWARVTGTGTYSGVTGTRRLGRVVSTADEPEDIEEDEEGFLKITIEFRLGAYDEDVGHLAYSEFWDDFYIKNVRPARPTKEELAEWMLMELSR